MSETEGPNRWAPPRSDGLLLSHVAQLGLAMVVVCLDAYKIQHVAYNSLIYSLVVAVCTILICAVLIILQLHGYKLWHHYVLLIHSIWMVIFWLIDLGLIANLATTFKPSVCSDGADGDIPCKWITTRNTIGAIVPRRTSFHIYHATLIAVAILAAFEACLWFATSVMLYRYGHQSPPPEEPEYEVRARPVQPAAVRMPMSPESPQLNPRRPSGYSAGGITLPKSSQWTMPVDWDNDNVGIERVVPQPVLPDDSESDGTLQSGIDIANLQHRGLAVAVVEADGLDLPTTGSGNSLAASSNQSQRGRSRVRNRHSARSSLRLSRAPSDASDDHIPMDDIPL